MKKFTLFILINIISSSVLASEEYENPAIKLKQKLELQTQLLNISLLESSSAEFFHYKNELKKAGSLKKLKTKLIAFKMPYTLEEINKKMNSINPYSPSMDDELFLSQYSLYKAKIFFEKLEKSNISIDLVEIDLIENNREKLLASINKLKMAISLLEGNHKKILNSNRIASSKKSSLSEKSQSQANNVTVN